MPRKKENKNKKSFRGVSTRPVIENSKKIAKNIQKIRKHLIASFPAKIGCQRPQKRENKNYRSFPFRSYPTHKRKPQKNSKQIQKTKKIV